MAQGFIIQQSDRTVPGASDASGVLGTIYGQVFTCGGTGPKTVTELGMFCSRDTDLGYFRLAIFNVDGSNNPTTLVGQTSELQAPSSEGWVSETGLSITVTGGSSYALVYWPEDSQHNVRDYSGTGGTAFTSSSAQHGATYPTWPSSFTHSDVSYQLPVYAVYAIAEVVSIIDPNSGTGYDYDSLYDWEAAEQGDLTTARNEIAVAKCRCTGGTADTTAVSIIGWTMSATQYIKIWTDTAESYRHNGTYQTGNKYRLETTTNGIYIGSSTQISFVRIEGIQFQLNASSLQVCVYAITASAASEVRISKCIFKDISGTAQSMAVRIYDTDFTLKVSNCIFYDFNDAISGSVDINLRYCGTAYLFNNTHVDGVIAINRHATNGGTAYVKNCIFDNFLFDTPTYGLVNTDCDYNSASDSDLGYTASAHDRVSQTFTFVNEANDNFALASGDGGALGFGANLYNDANLAFQDDILGTVRGGSGAVWDIGAFHSLEKVSIVDPDAGTGYDYDSLYDWEAAEQVDLTNENRIKIATCRCTGGTADTTTSGILFSGWTTSATQYIKVWTDPAESYRHDGKYVSTGNVYRIVSEVEPSGIIGVTTGAQYIRFDGLLIVSTNDTASVYVILYDPAGGLHLTNCVIHATAATKNNSQGLFLSTGHTGAYSYIVNNIFYNHNVSIYSRADGPSGRAFIYNNTVYGSTTGIRSRGDGNTAKNNLVIGCTDCFLESTEFETATDNAYDEGTDPGSDGVDLSSYTDAQIFTDVATFDFSPAVSSPVIGVGTNLYNDANYPFQDDIIGTDRGGSGASWDIGAFEYVAAGGETYSETVTDGFKGGETLARISTFRNVITDGFSGGESMARRADLDLLSSDGAKVGEVLVRILTLSQTASDGIAISEQIINSASLSLTATDRAALGDSAARRLDLSANITDGCKLSEVLATALLLSAAVADGAKFSETITTDLSGILEEIISDGFRAGDSPSSLAQFIRAVADQFNLSETVAAILRAAIIATDGIKTVDSTSAVGTFARSASDAIVLTDATAGDIITGIIQAIVADGFRFSETTATVANFQITVTDGAKFAETIATIMSMMEAIADGLGLSDSASISTEAALASGRVTITFSMKGSRVVFTVTRPRVQFTLH